MTIVTSWWWIRHAPVTTDKGRVYGQEDMPADCSDRPTFDGLAQALPKNAVWIASNLKRTHQTAAAIAAAGHPAPALVLEPDLAEQHFGQWQGMPRDEVYARFADWHRFWLAPAYESPPGGESFVQVIGRVAGVVERLLKAHSGRDLVVVAHGGTIRAALAIALRLNPDAALAFSVDNCSLTQIEHVSEASGDGFGRGAWRVRAVNHHPRAGRIGAAR
jgi:alpha-ribazole phosphatase